MQKSDDVIVMVIINGDKSVGWSINFWEKRVVWSVLFGCHGNSYGKLGS
jgi:hypothetical protein